MAKNEANRSAGTETHLAVDDKINQGYTQEAMREGYGAASGVRGATAESGGKLDHPETSDNSRTPERKKNPADLENAGLADS